MNSLSTSLPDPREPVPSLEIFILPGSSARPDSSTASFLILEYSKDDLQQIFKAVLETRTSTVTAPLPEDLWERLLKVRFPDIYQGKTDMKCYNFCQRCKDYFAITGTKGPNCISFITSFLWDKVLFCWQKHKCKLENKTTMPITWDKFSVFLHCGLKESQVFVDGIWRKFKKNTLYQLETVND